jgi:hypothetical protein
MEGRSAIVRFEVPEIEEKKFMLKISFKKFDLIKIDD